MSQTSNLSWNSATTWSVPPSAVADQDVPSQSTIDARIRIIVVHVLIGGGRGSFSKVDELIAAI